MMYTMPKNLLSICVNFTLATQHSSFFMRNRLTKRGYERYNKFVFIKL